MTAFDDLVAGGVGETQFLVEITASIGSGAVSLGAKPPLGVAPLGVFSLGVAIAAGEINTGTVTLRYGDRHWVGSPTDADKPNIYFEGRLQQPLVMERALPLFPEDSRRIQRQIGAIEIANGDGALDDPSLYAVDGRRVRVWFGPAMPSDSGDFGLVADALATGWEGDDATKRLLLRDRGYALDLPLQTNFYDGTGDDEGGTEAKGKPKPLCFGKVLNISPPLIDATALTYQIHDGSIEAVDGVYDRAAALTFGADHADYAALVAATVSAGHYDTCLAEGWIRLGSSPAGLITADVRGDNDATYADTLDDIALRIIETYAGIDTAFVDDASFADAAAIDGTALGTLGIWISAEETPTAADVLDRLFGSAAAWWGADRDGLIKAGRIEDPADQTPAFFLDDTNIVTVEPEAPPTPRFRQRVGYQPNWTPQQTDLASSVTDARKQFLAGPQRIVTWFDGTVRTRHLQAVAGELGSLYDSSADAQAIADYLGDLFGVDRGIWRVTIERGYDRDLGQYGRLTYGRFGLASGRNVVVVGVSDDGASGRTVLRVFG